MVNKTGDKEATHKTKKAALGRVRCKDNASETTNEVYQGIMVQKETINEPKVG